MNHGALIPRADSEPLADVPRHARRLPEGAYPLSVNWRYAVVLTLVHGLALLALVPALYSWQGVASLVAGYFVFGMLGITIGYHRLLSHRSFACPKFVEYTLALLGACCLQESPVRWVAIHRMHHRHSDHRPDPHSPRAHLVWGYAGWLYLINRDHWLYANYSRYARDLLRDPFYARLERNLLSLWVYLAHAVLFFLLGYGLGWFLQGNQAAAMRLGGSLLVWGVLLRTVVFLHVSWSVNALCHVWGYRNYDTSDSSRNNWLLGLIAHGDGWHNNHHALQRSARHGRKWWEVDLSYAVIRLMARLGLARDILDD